MASHILVFLWNPRKRWACVYSSDATFFHTIFAIELMLGIERITHLPALQSVAFRPLCCSDQGDNLQLKSGEVLPVRSSSRACGSRSLCVLCTKCETENKTEDGVTVGPSHLPSDLKPVCFRVG